MAKLLKSVVCASALLASIGTASSAAKYDGSWSVVVITERGDCDRAYRYPVRVVNGAIQYLSEAGISITGRVDGSGRLRAVIRRGDQQAEGSGRLSGATGAGTWRGRDNFKQCSGRWEAERRGG